MGDAASAAYLLFSAGFIQFLADAAGEVANDPPRYDFRQPVAVRPPRAHSEKLWEPDPFGGPAARTAEAADEASRTLTAARIAFERYQGALERHRPEFARQRLFESIELAHRASEPLFATADAADDLYRDAGLDPRREQWAVAYSRGIDRGAIGNARDLPVEVLALLYVGGVPFGLLERLVRQRPRRVPPFVREDALEFPRTLRQLAEHFGGWQPPVQAFV